MKTTMRICFGVLLLLAGNQTVQSQQRPASYLAVQDATPIGGHLVVTVRNTSSLEITAWGITGQVTFTSGPPQTVKWMVDGYSTGFKDDQQPAAAASFPLISERVLSKRHGVRLREGVVTNVSLAPSLVVFADGSAVGDESDIRFIFEARQIDRRASELIQSVLAKHVESVNGSSSALAIIERQLDDGADDQVKQSPPYKTFRMNLSIVSKSGLTDPDAHARLVTLQQSNQSLRAAAKAHSQRR